MEHKHCAEYEHIRLRPLGINDIELLRKWRNDAAYSKFLRPIGTITAEMQRAWFDKYLSDPSNITFAIEEIRDLNRVVGSVSLYDFDGTSAEVGKIVVGDPEAKGKKIGFYALLLAMHLGYQKLGIENFRGEVHEDNLPAKTIDMRLGFVITGKHPFTNGGYELDMILPKDHFGATHNFLNDIKLYEV